MEPGKTGSLLRPGAALRFRSYEVSAPFPLSSSWPPLSSAYVAGAAGLRCGRRPNQAPRGGRDAVYVSGLAGAGGGRGSERPARSQVRSWRRRRRRRRALAGALRCGRARVQGGARRARGRAFRSPAAAGPPPPLGQWVCSASSRGRRRRRRGRRRSRSRIRERHQGSSRRSRRRCAEEPETRADEVAAAAERERGADAGGARRRG